MALSHVKPSSSTSEPAAVDDADVLLSSETVAALAEPNATEAPGVCEAAGTARVHSSLNLVQRDCLALHNDGRYSPSLPVHAAWLFFPLAGVPLAISQSMTCSTLRYDFPYVG